MSEQLLSFENLPQAVATLTQEVRDLKSLINQTMSNQSSQDTWLNVKALCDYHPDKPSPATVYSWVSQKLIPYHKSGKKLRFLQSEIDNWLLDNRRKTDKEIKSEAIDYVNRRKGGLK